VRVKAMTSVKQIDYDRASQRRMRNEWANLNINRLARETGERDCDRGKALPREAVVRNRCCTALQKNNAAAHLSSLDGPLQRPRISTSENA